MHIQGRNIDSKIFILFQTVIVGAAAAERNLSFIFRISGSDDQRFFWMTDLYEQGDQLRGTVPNNYILDVRADIFGNMLAKPGVIPVRITHDGVDMLRQRGL